MDTNRLGISLPNTVLGLILSVGLTPATGQAEVFKCVDAQGRTTYTERMGECIHTKPAPVRLPTPSGSTASPSPDYWQTQETQFRQRQIDRQENTGRPVVTPRPKALSNGLSDDTDASRCALARDILSGAVRHSNGAPTDAYDRETAENDVRAFCR